MSKIEVEFNEALHIAKKIQTKVKPKRLKLNGLFVSQKCYECNATYHYFLWSPLWCPKCDLERIERITKSLEDISKSFEEKKE